MKNNSGISLITLLITIIVMLIIASITTYNGLNMINDTRKKDATDKLKVICNALIKDDSFLVFDYSNKANLNRDDYDYMDLLKYYDEAYPVTITKKEEINENYNKVITYSFSMYNTKREETYTYSYENVIYNDNTNYLVSFDESAGVNRPIITEGMKPLMPDGYTEVEDLYKTSWYSYKKNNPNFAKMEYNGKIYLWVPRFAYIIQAFYDGRVSKAVPNSAINIVFLRETSNYMPNDEILQTGYIVHPAFSNNGHEYSGLWIEQKSNDSKASLPSTPLYEAETGLHMMTNYECGAALYLEFAFNTEQFEFLKNEYVASSTGSVGRFNHSEGFVTLYDVDSENVADIAKSYGDAMFETAWDRVTANIPTISSPYVIRLFETGLFDYTCSNGSDSATYRGTIVIK